MWTHFDKNNHRVRISITVCSVNKTSLGHATLPAITATTVKHVCNDHLYNTIYYLWFIQ